jgi:hypothetical protein
MVSFPLVSAEDSGARLGKAVQFQIRPDPLAR